MLRWLPTLDTSIRVGLNNQIEFRFYEKPVCSKKTVQLKSAMAENPKQQILSNDLIRRLLNTSEELGAGAICKVVDQYAQDLLNSGFRKEQTRKILLNGIKGYEAKKKRRAAEGRSLRSTAQGSRGSRIKKKLLGKSNWYKNRKNTRSTQENKSNSAKGSRKCKDKKIPGEQTPPMKTVLFVEHTKNGELATKLRELTRRLAPTLGFSVKVVERAGATLKSLFPLGSLWEGATCPREDCTTCRQGAEQTPNCTKSSLVYENVCQVCNPGAGAEGELKEVRSDIPTIYVGESSRSIYERSKEHWAAVKSNKEDSHMVRHQLAEHHGREPNFTMRTLKFFKSALTRQIAEAVRIRRRGGAGSILNSKAEFDRCRIPRLVVEEQDLEEMKRMEEQDENEQEKQLEEQATAWSKSKLNKKKEESRNKYRNREQTQNKKREPEPQGAKKTKKRRFGLLPEQWGAENPDELLESNPHQDPTLQWELGAPEQESSECEQQPPLLQPPKEQRTSGRRRQPKIVSFLSAGPTSRQTDTPKSLDEKTAKIYV